MSQIFQKRTELDLFFFMNAGSFSLVSTNFNFCLSFTSISKYANYNRWIVLLSSQVTEDTGYQQLAVLVNLQNEKPLVGMGQIKKKF